jgi:hypothetical protein
MQSIKVTCPPGLQNYSIPSFNLTFSAGTYEITDPDLIRFLLRYPTKSIPINPQEVADKKILSAEEVAGFGYEIIVGTDKKTGEPIKAEPDTEAAENFVVPEGLPEFPKMTLRELKEWMDDPEHPVKYEDKWHKEQYVRACERAAKKLAKPTAAKKQ